MELKIALTALVVLFMCIGLLHLDVCSPKVDDILAAVALFAIVIGIIACLFTIWGISVC